MRYLVTIRFDLQQQKAIAAQLPAEQAHVRALMAQGIIQAIHIAADQSRVWLEMEGESPDQIRQTMTSFPLYPFMELEVTPLLEVRPSPVRL
jgi:muconolactone delta-isomerase